MLTRYYKKNEERLQKKAQSKRYQNLSERERKEKVSV